MILLISDVEEDPKNRVIMRNLWMAFRRVMFPYILFLEKCGHKRTRYF
jgi:hypothetical protein